MVGARPNYMKVAPVLRALRARRASSALLIHTGQHYDAELSDVFLAELRLRAPDVGLGVGSGSHGEQTAAALVGVERVLDRAPAGARRRGRATSTRRSPARSRRSSSASRSRTSRRVCAASTRRCPRSTTAGSPTTSAPSSSPTRESATTNLEREGIDAGTVHLVGNTMIDSLFACLERAPRARPGRRSGSSRASYVLVTLHRPALVDDARRCSRDTVAALAELAAEHAGRLPRAPADARTARRRAGSTRPSTAPACSSAAGRRTSSSSGSKSEAAFVLTDSGGVQEETSALGVPCFTLRDSTERPVTVELGTNTLLGPSPTRIAEIPAPASPQPARRR